MIASASMKLVEHADILEAATARAEVLLHRGLQPLQQELLRRPVHPVQVRLDDVAAELRQRGERLHSTNQSVSGSPAGKDPVGFFNRFHRKAEVCSLERRERPLERSPGDGIRQRSRRA